MFNDTEFNHYSLSSINKSFGKTTKETAKGNISHGKNTNVYNILQNSHYQNLSLIIICTDSFHFQGLLKNINVPFAIRVIKGKIT